MKKKLVCIVGAGELDPGELNIPKGAFVIAADGGLRHLDKSGISPDLIMGDFDSLGHIPKRENVIYHKPEKNDTDTMLAVKHALEMGAETILIYGGLGGRFDHSIANLQTLHYIANHGAMGFLIGGGSVCTVIRGGAVAFDEGMRGFISVFSMTEVSAGVCLTGLKYPLCDYDISCDFPLGVSNEFTGLPATISVKRGALAIIWEALGYTPGDCRKI